jgi:excisionase family DNA binding protein
MATAPTTTARGTVSLDRLLTVAEAADALSTTPRFVRRLIAERRICFHHVGRHVRVAQRDLEGFVAAGRVSPSMAHEPSGTPVR